MSFKSISPISTNKWVQIRRIAADVIGQIAEPGDIIIRLSNAKIIGFFPISKIIAYVTDSKYSHAAMIIEDQGDDILVADVGQNGIERQFLIDWISGVAGDSIGLLRPRLSRDTIGYAIEVCNEIIAIDPYYNPTFEEHIDVKQYAKLREIKKDTIEKKGLYCTQLPYVCYEAAGVDLGPPTAIKHLPNWWRVFNPIIRLFGIDPNTRIYYAGNYGSGLMASSMLGVEEEFHINDFKKISNLEDGFTEESPPIDG